jgi:prolyl oligopeptidase
VFDDFEAAAEHLISRLNLTSPARLAIQGASNGGTLVAACANQRPDLFAAALPTVGVHDMARFDRFTIGHAWRSDFGDPRDAEQLRAMTKWSPLHNVAAPSGGTRNFPATLIMTGDHDDRVPPLHSYKLGAALQRAAAQNPSPAKAPQRNPILLRVETRAGHGAGKPTAKQIEELSDIYGFLADVMGAKFGEENN